MTAFIATVTIPTNSEGSNEFLRIVKSALEKANAPGSPISTWEVVFFPAFNGARITVDYEPLEGYEDYNPTEEQVEFLAALETYLNQEARK